MLCEKPYFIGCVPAACTKCFPCRVNRRRLWAHRIHLESLVSSDSCFVTLTYDEDYLPKGAVLEPKHVKLWLKRLRKLLYPQKIRYFLVGEYGTQTFRPHYHVALFGLHPFLAGGRSGQSGFVARTWNYGFVSVGELNHDSAMYIAGYCTKKMTSRKDPRLNGRPPEFSRMSLRPGIGAPAMADVATAIANCKEYFAYQKTRDVPYTLDHGRRSLPLGRYLRGVLRKKLGFGSSEVPAEAAKEFGLSMRVLFQDGLKTQKDKTLWNSRSLAKIWSEQNLQKVRNLKARTAAYEKDKVLI